MKRMFLIDGSNHAFRVHFALPPRHTSSGFPTRVLYGFTMLFAKILRTFKPDYVVVAFDKGKTFRSDLFPAYKGHRPEMPDDLRRQWPLLEQIVEGFGYNAITLPGYEADDVLGTLAKQHAGPDCEAYLVTSDKDFCQLVDDHTFVLDIQKNVTLDREGVVEKWGVPPEKVVDLLGLAGDTSDNIPGITKVGPKTAAKYLGQFETFEGVLEAAARGEIKGKTGQRVADEADIARLSRTLATIATDAPHGLTLADLEPRGLQVEALRELFDAWEFGSVARKLLPATQQVDMTTWQTLDDPEAIAALLASLTDQTPGVDATVDDAGQVTGLALALEERTVYMPMGTSADGAVLAYLASDAPKIGHGLKRLHHVLMRSGHRLRGVAGDTRLLDYLLAPHLRRHAIEDMASRHLAHAVGVTAATSDTPEVAAAVERAAVARQLHLKLSPRLSEGQRAVYTELELPLTPVLAEMEARGIRLDAERIQDVSTDIGARLEALVARCHELAGRTFNVRSRHELRDVLFEDLALPPSKKVKDGWSTDSSVLEKLVGLHPLPATILEYRMFDKLRSTYLSKLPKYVAEDGRIHTSFNQAMAATGRLSSADPNLQNIPIRTREGRRIRGCFVPKPGHVFLSADYSQVELRVLAHVSEDEVLLEGFREGQDIHRRTAVEIFGADPEDVTVEQRSAAKAINFGLLYGMSAFRLARDLQIERKQAQAYMETYFARMPRVQDWIESTKAFCHEHGYVDTLYGRRRLISEIHASDVQTVAMGEREAVNTVIQGTAADLIKRAMLRVASALRAGAYKAELILQVHDELLLEVPEAEVDAVTRLVVENMVAAGDLSVPLVVNSAVGADWEQAHG